MSDTVVPFPEGRRDRTLKSTPVDAVYNFVWGLIGHKSDGNIRITSFDQQENDISKRLVQISFNDLKTSQDIYGTIIIAGRTDTFCEVTIQIDFPETWYYKPARTPELNIYRAVVSHNNQISFARMAGTLDVEGSIKKMFEPREERTVGKYIKTLFPVPELPAPVRANPVHTLQARIKQTFG